MEEKLALVNCLTILYCETIASEEKGRHHDLIRKTVNAIKVPEIVSESDDRASLIFLKKTILDIVDHGITFDTRQIVQSFRITCSFDTATYKALDALLNQDIKEEEAKKDIVGYVQHLELYYTRQEVKKIVQRASWGIDSGDGNFRELIGKLREDLGKFDRPTDNGEVSSFVGRVGSSKEEFAAVLRDTKRELEGAVLKTGWQDINKMLGIKKGISPGELIVIPALPHNAKTTFSVALSVSLCLFNKAEDFVKPGEKAMILDITLENELNQNLPIVYKMVREYDTGEYVDLRDIDPDEAAEYIVNRLAQNGWTYVFERHVSTDFSIETFRSVVERKEREGYKIVVARVDYLGVANKVGLGNGSIGSEVRETYRRARNLAARRKMVLISPHQLSPAAKALRAMDPMKYVRELPGKGMYDGCTTVDNEVDLEIYIGITEANGNSYLECQRGKHRTLTDTPLKHRYCVLKFAEVGVLPWDVELEHPLSFPSIAADAMANEEDDFLVGMF